MNIYELMNSLCLREKKKAYIDNNNYWLGKSIDNKVYCILCEKIVAEKRTIKLSEYLNLIKGHAIAHLKERNLLPFI